MSPSPPARCSPLPASPRRPRSSTARSYLPTGVGLLLFGLGAGIAMPAATELIMATLPPARAGVGSAVNDTVRELGGALGVAVIGSVAATSYAASLQSELTPLPRVHHPRAAPVHRQRRQRPPHERPARSERNRDRVARPYRVRDSMSGSLWVAVGLAITATVIAVVYLPRREQKVHAEATHGALVHVEPIAPVLSAPQHDGSTFSGTDGAADSCAVRTTPRPNERNARDQLP